MGCMSSSYVKDPYSSGYKEIKYKNDKYKNDKYKNSKPTSSHRREQFSRI